LRPKDRHKTERKTKKLNQAAAVATKPKKSKPKKNVQKTAEEETQKKFPVYLSE